MIGADALSRWVDWEDRNSCILFGDGAGAMVLEAADSDDAAGLLGETVSIVSHRTAPRRDALDWVLLELTGVGEASRGRFFIDRWRWRCPPPSAVAGRPVHP